MRSEVYKEYRIDTGWLFTGYIFIIYDSKGKLVFSSNKEFPYEDKAVEKAKKLIDEIVVADTEKNKQ